MSNAKKQKKFTIYIYIYIHIYMYIYLNSGSYFKWVDLWIYKYKADSYYMYTYGLPWWLSGEEPPASAGRWGFDPCTGNIPIRRGWQPTPVFLPGNPMDRGTWWASAQVVTKRVRMAWWLNIKKMCVYVYKILADIFYQLFNKFHTKY